MTNTAHVPQIPRLVGTPQYKYLALRRDLDDFV